MKYVSNIIKLAQSWVGKKESNGTHKEIIDIYNSHKPLARGYKVKYTDAWCATFISALSIKLGYTDIIPTECGCEKQINLFKKLGCWVENENRTPEVGDIIYYDWQDNGKGDNKGSSDHVGIVEKVEGNNLTIIEGNINNAVGRRKLKVNGKYIRGYGVPKYDVEAIVSVELKYKLGDKVVVSSYYKTSEDPVEKAVHKTKTGTITKVLTNGAKNPYLLNEGDIGWCNDGDIRGLANNNTKPLSVGSKVKIKSSAKRYCTGQSIPSSVKGKLYTIAQIGNKKYKNGILLKEILSWVNRSDLEY